MNSRVRATQLSRFQISVINYQRVRCRYQPAQLTLQAELENTIISVGANVLVQISTDIPEEEIKSVEWSPAIPCADCLEYTFENVQENIEHTVTITTIIDCMETVESE